MSEGQASNIFLSQRAIPDEPSSPRCGAMIKAMPVSAGWLRMEEYRRSPIQIIGRERGRRPNGNAASIFDISAGVRRSVAAPAFSMACSTFDAFGMESTDGRRVRNASAA